MTSKILLCFHTQDASQLQRFLKKLWQQWLREGEGKGKEAQQGCGGRCVSDLDLLLEKVNFVLLLQELLLLSCNLWRNGTEETWDMDQHSQSPSTGSSDPAKSLNPSWELRNLWGCCCSKGHRIVQEQFIANTREKGTLMENAGLHTRQGPGQKSHWNGTAKIPQETEQPQQRNQKMVAKGRKSKKRRMARNTLLFGTTCSRSF